MGISFCATRTHFSANTCSYWFHRVDIAYFLTILSSLGAPFSPIRNDNWIIWVLCLSLFCLNYYLGYTCLATINTLVSIQLHFHLTDLTTHVLGNSLAHLYPPSPSLDNKARHNSNTNLTQHLQVQVDLPLLNIIQITLLPTQTKYFISPQTPSKQTRWLVIA